MKRYWVGKKFLSGVIGEALDGEFVYFDDHQAALQELAREVLPFIDDRFSKNALIAKLRALAEWQP